MLLSRVFLCIARLLKSIFCEYQPTWNYNVSIIYPRIVLNNSYFEKPYLLGREYSNRGLARYEMWQVPLSIRPVIRNLKTTAEITKFFFASSSTSDNSFQSWISALERKILWHTAQPRNPRRCPSLLQHWGHFQIDLVIQWLTNSLEKLTVYVFVWSVSCVCSTEASASLYRPGSSLIRLYRSWSCPGPPFSYLITGRTGRTGRTGVKWGLISISRRLDLILFKHQLIET